MSDGQHFCVCGEVVDHAEIERLREMVKLGADHIEYHQGQPPQIGCGACRGAVELMRSYLGGDDE